MSKIKILISILLLQLVGPFIPVAFCYELATHGAVTYNAFQRSVLNDLETQKI